MHKEGTGGVLFISWSENCTRSDSIAKRLGGASLMIYSPFWGSRASTIVFKYLSQSVRTLAALWKYRPGAVLVMTPPVIACVPVWIYAKLTGAHYAIDAHTGAFLDKRWTWSLFIHRFFSRQATLTLVTSPFLADLVRSWKARVQIVSDVPVCFAEPQPVKLNGGIHMTFISTFTRDEPLPAFLEAAKLVPDVQFHVTGRLKDANRGLLEQAPPNVRFTDFLSDPDYVGLLLGSDAVICLTTEDHTMQRGAYEAVYLGRPVITSDFPILRNAFHRGTVHVGGTPREIAAGIVEMKNNSRRYQKEVEELRAEKVKRWGEVEADLNRALGHPGFFVQSRACE